MRWPFRPSDLQKSSVSRSSARMRWLVTLAPLRPFPNVRSMASHSRFLLARATRTSRWGAILQQCGVAWGRGTGVHPTITSVHLLIATPWLRLLGCSRGEYRDKSQHLHALQPQGTPIHLVQQTKQPFTRPPHPVLWQKSPHLSSTSSSSFIAGVLTSLGMGGGDGGLFEARAPPSSAVQVVEGDRGRDEQVQVHSGQGLIRSRHGLQRTRRACSPPAGGGWPQPSRQLPTSHVLAAQGACISPARMQRCGVREQGAGGGLLAPASVHIGALRHDDPQAEAHEEGHGEH